MFKPFTLRGAGVHTGSPCEVLLSAAPEGTGTLFVTPQGDVPASFEYLHDASRGTNLMRDGARINTVEHLLAAMAWLGATDVFLEVSGPEIPILDGSSRPWIDAATEAGLEKHTRYFHLSESIEVSGGTSRASLVPVDPGDSPRYTVEMEFPDRVPIEKTASFEPRADDFVNELAPARTFALESEVAAIREAGLGAGGSLDNTVVLGANGVLNPGGTRFDNEPARHKLLDAIGDLFLLGGLPWAHLHIFRPGHLINHKLIRAASRARAEYHIDP